MEDDAKTDVMDVKRGARLCVSFYEMFAASALAVSFACGLILFINRMKSSAVVAVIVVATFWFKVATMVFIWFTTKRKSGRFFYYYKNVGMSIRWLWGMALVFDFLTYVVCMLIAYQL